MQAGVVGTPMHVWCNMSHTWYPAGDLVVAIAFSVFSNRSGRYALKMLASS